MATSQQTGFWPWLDESPRTRWVAELAVWAVVFYFISRLGLRYARIDEQVSAILPGSGLGLAVLLWRGFRVWPAMMVAGLTARYAVEPDFVQALGLSAGGTAMGIYGA